MTWGLPIVHSHVHAPGLRLLYTSCALLRTSTGSAPERCHRALSGPRKDQARRATGSPYISRTPVYDGAGLIRRRSVAIGTQRHMTWSSSESDSCHVILPAAALAYRATPHSITYYSPFFLETCHDIVLPISQAWNKRVLAPLGAQWLHALWRCRLSVLRAHQRIAEHNRHAASADSRGLAPGMHAALRLTFRERQDAGKFSPSFKSPYIVRRVLPCGTTAELFDPAAASLALTLPSFCLFFLPFFCTWLVLFASLPFLPSRLPHGAAPCGCSWHTPSGRPAIPSQPASLARPAQPVQPAQPPPTPKPASLQDPAARAIQSVIPGQSQMADLKHVAAIKAVLGPATTHGVLLHTELVDLYRPLEPMAPYAATSLPSHRPSRLSIVSVFTLLAGLLEDATPAATPATPSAPSAVSLATAPAAPAAPPAHLPALPPAPSALATAPPQPVPPAPAPAAAQTATASLPRRKLLYQHLTSCSPPLCRLRSNLYQRRKHHSFWCLQHWRSNRRTLCRERSL
ncbi:hypothetical protein Efla_006005 [Eimeria flavescens]